MLSLVSPAIDMSHLTDPLPFSSVVLGNVVFAIMGGLCVLALLGLPLLRVVAVLVGTSKWLSKHVGRGKPWGAAGFDDVERPLTLAGLSPPLASLARQTRTLALELRRRSEAARHWPEDAVELEGARVSSLRWWSSLVGETVDFTPLMDTRREVFDWLGSADALGEVDREALTRLGIDVEAVRAALTTTAPTVEHIRTLAGLLWTIDERLAGATTCGYRANAAHADADVLHGLGPGFDAGDDAGDDELHDRRRFAEVFGHHGRGLSRMAGSYARTPAEREDLEQDIALALWTSLPRFRGESKLETFIYRVARYTCYRHARRRGRLPSDAAAVATLQDPADLERLMLDADIRRQIEQALAQLPESLESTMSLHLAGLSYAEIAARLGISEQNVSVRLTRARQRLQLQLAA